MEPRGIFHLMLGVGNACNLACLHCYREEKGAFSDELDFDELTRAMHELAAACEARGLSGLVTFGGGEPLMRRDLADLIRLARLFGLTPRLITNGTMLTPPRIAEIQQAGVGLVQVSLDGAKPETHDRVRGPGRFAQAVRGIRGLVEAGLYVDIKVTMLPGHNDHEMAEFFALAAELGVPKISFGRLIPIGSGEQFARPLGPERLHAWIERLVAAAREAPGTVLDLREPTYDRSYLLPNAALAQEVPTDLPLSIDSDGTVYPNRRLPVSLGNFRDGHLEDFLAHPLLQAFQELRFGGRCATCELLSVCRGGSRASAYGSGHDPLGEDPDCWFRPGAP